jgi:DNA-directed RNA polymerase specialized sigma24 family protein
MARGLSKNRGVVIDDYVPTDNNDLVRHYEPYVTRLTTRYNRVSTNFKDLLQHVWLKIFEARLIEKYHRAGGTLPKTLTAPQACAYLQMNFSAFKFAIWRFKVGDDRIADSFRVSKTISGAVFERDRGICWRCGKDMDRLQKNLVALKKKETVEVAEFQQLLVDFGDETIMVTLKPKESKWKAIRQQMKDRFGISSRHRIFWIAERVPGQFQASIDNYRTTCLCCVHMMNPPETRVRRKSTWAPLPIEGGYTSQKAVFLSVDIERFKAYRDEPERVNRIKKQTAMVPFVTQNRPIFKLYLARSVHNIYANWCRTRSRRYKEEYHGNNEDGSSWDSFLEDSRCRPDDMVDLYHTSKLLASGEEDIRDVDFTDKDIDKTQGKILALLADGYTLPEVVQKLSLPQSLIHILTA